PGCAATARAPAAPAASCPSRSPRSAAGSSLGARPAGAARVPGPSPPGRLQQRGRPPGTCLALLVRGEERPACLSRASAALPPPPAPRSPGSVAVAAGPGQGGPHTGVAAGCPSRGLPSATGGRAADNPRTPGGPRPAAGASSPPGQAVGHALAE